MTLDCDVLSVALLMAGAAAAALEGMSSCSGLCLGIWAGAGCLPRDGQALSARSSEARVLDEAKFSLPPTMRPSMKRSVAGWPLCGCNRPTADVRPVCWTAGAAGPAGTAVGGAFPKPFEAVCAPCMRRRLASLRSSVTSDGAPVGGGTLASDLRSAARASAALTPLQLRLLPFSGTETAGAG